jgi:hypothetical protein
MGTASSRRVRLLDVLVVVAGIGVGLAPARSYLVEHNLVLILLVFAEPIVVALT